MASNVAPVADALEKAAQEAANQAREMRQKAATTLPGNANQETRDAIGAASARITAAITTAINTITSARRATNPHQADQANSSAVDAAKDLQEADAALQLATDAADAASMEAVGYVTAAMAEAQKVVTTAQTKAVRAIRRTGVRRTRIISSALIVVPAAVAIAGWWIFGEPKGGRVGAVTFGAGVMAAALLALLFLGGERGLLRPLIGSDNRVSTSKTQIGIWTVAMGYALAYLAGRVFWDGAKLDDVINNDRLDEYLILLGGPFAASILAKLTVTWRLDNGSLQKTTAPDATVSQVIENDAGDADLVDSQYLIFNFVALAYFIVRLGIDMELPEMPAVMLGLTSASAATYVAAKAAQRNAPVITSVTPSAFRAGQQIRVGGSNFWTEGDTVPAGVAVTIDDFDGVIAPLPSSTSGDLVTVVPYGVPAGNNKLKVTTPTRVTSEGYAVQILEDKPMLIGTDGVLAPGATGRLLGKHLLSPGSTAATEQVSVLVGGDTVVGTATEADVTFPVPATLTSGASVTLAVTRGGSSSDAISVTIG